MCPPDSSVNAKRLSNDNPMCRWPRCRTAIRRCVLWMNPKWGCGGTLIRVHLYSWARNRLYHLSCGCVDYSRTIVAHHESRPCSVRVCSERNNRSSYHRHSLWSCGPCIGHSVYVEMIARFIAAILSVKSLDVQYSVPLHMNLAVLVVSVTGWIVGTKEACPISVCTAGASSGHEG